VAAYVCRRNRRKPAVDEVPSAAGFAWAIPHNSAVRRVMSFPPSANREMGAGTNETGRSPCCSFAAQTLTKGRTSCYPKRLLPAFLFGVNDNSE